MLLHHSPYLPTCKTKAYERAFAAEKQGTLQVLYPSQCAL